jgi:glucose-6-phosphate 1-dehydrogenase
LTVLIQPDEGFELGFEIKTPGREIKLQTQRMRFHYADVFGPLSDGYETLLVDVVRGDPTLFVRADEVEEAWKLYEPLLKNPPTVAAYPAGSQGPAEANRLTEEDSFRWYPIERPASS